MQCRGACRRMQRELLRQRKVNSSKAQDTSKSSKKRKVEKLTHNDVLVANDEAEAVHARNDNDATKDNDSQTTINDSNNNKIKPNLTEEHNVINEQAYNVMVSGTRAKRRKPIGVPTMSVGSPAKWRQYIQHRTSKREFRCKT